MKKAISLLLLIFTLFLLIGIITDFEFGPQHAAAAGECHTRNTWHVNLSYENQSSERFPRFELNENPLCYQVNVDNWRIGYVYVELDPRDTVGIFMAETADDEMLHIANPSDGYSPRLLIPIDEHVTIQLKPYDPVTVNFIEFKIRGADEASVSLEDMRCSSCSIDVEPNGGLDYIFTLRRSDDHVVMPFESCEGEFSIFVQGIRDDDDILIGVDQPFETIDLLDASWDRERHRLYATVNVSRSAANEYPLWRAYAFNATGDTVRAFMWVNSPDSC